jgi:hypothetical protein
MLARSRQGFPLLSATLPTREIPRAAAGFPKSQPWIVPTKALNKPAQKEEKPGSGQPLIQSITLKASRSNLFYAREDLCGRKKKPRAALQRRGALKTAKNSVPV